jgi:hypothetical protein
MADAVFKYVPYTVSSLVDAVKMGTLALPDIQRPFVWSTPKVRDLFDSMYRGYPVGQVMFWKTGPDAGGKQIGLGEKPLKVPEHSIVDGQQRITSLYAVATGESIVLQDYSVRRLRLAFNPFTERFEIPDAAIDKQPEWLPDITPLFTDLLPTILQYQDRIARAGKNPDLEMQKKLFDVFGRVNGLLKYQFSVVELDASADAESVAEVFVRINSEGVTLNQADFILTMMSVFWEEGRQALEAFCRRCVQPSVSGSSPFNWFIRPRPAQLVRVSVALAYRRAVLRNVYTILRGRDLATGKADPAKRDEQYRRLAKAQTQVLNLLNWHEFFQSVERAGFRSAAMISSDTALLYSYSLWLVGRVDFNVPLDRLREVMARWFFMAQMTGRYSGSVESQFEQDLGRLTDGVSSASEYCAALDTIVNETLTNDFWTITLPNQLGSSSAKSPSLLAYLAALNVEDADILLSTGKVRSRMDPAIVAKKGIERHHLFPRKYLSKRLGVTQTTHINQIANMALVDWSDNNAISDAPPSIYWRSEVEKKLAVGGFDAERLQRQMQWHALPDGWELMEYSTFLALRRTMIADVIRSAFRRLQAQDYAPSYPPIQQEALDATTKPVTFYGVKIMDLLEAELLRAGTTLVGEADGEDVLATVRADGQIEFEGETYSTPSGAASAATGNPMNGWRFWAADTEEGMKTLADLRQQLVADAA